MSAEEHNRSSLISKLSASQIDDLIIEEYLRKSGYTFYYVVDPFDISNYCFPTGLSDRSGGTHTEFSEEDKIYEQVALDNLFQDKKNVFFTLDDHFDEYLDFEKTARRIQKRQLENPLVTPHFRENFREKEFSIQALDLHSLSTEDLANFISLSIGVLRRGKEKIDKLNNENRLLNEVDFIKDNIDYPDENSRLIHTYIKKSSYTDLYRDLYNYAYKIFQRKVEGSNISSYKKLNKEHNLLSDCKVIDLILSINKQLINDEEKILLIFLSSTDNSNKWFTKGNHFFEKKINDLIFAHLPEIKTRENKYRTFNPHRNSSQIFLQYILGNSTSSSDETLKSRVEKLTSFRDSYSTNFDENNNFKDYNYWVERTEDAKEISDKYGFISQYYTYKDIIDTAKDKAELKPYKKAVNAVLEMLNDATQEKEELSKKRDQTFRLFVFENTFLNMLSNGLKELEAYINKLDDVTSSNKFPSTDITDLIEKGEDKILGRYQILPLIFNLGDEEIRGLIEGYITFVVNTSSKSNDDYTKVIKDFYTNWYSDTQELLEKKFDEKSIAGKNNEIKLLRCLTFLILPKIHNQNSYVHRRAKEIINFEIEDNPANTEIIQNFRYIAAWAARRDNDLVKARNFTVQGLEEDNNDPRFHHSDALINYCEAFQDQNHVNFYRVITEEQKTKFQQTIFSSNRARELYMERFNERDETKYVIIALDNTIIYTSCCIWFSKFLSSKKTEPELEQLGNELSEIRTQLVDNIKEPDYNNYDNLLEFLHTEAYLEFLEANYLDCINKKDESVEKVRHAIKALKKAHRIDPESIECQDLLESLQNFEQKLSHSN